jgi:hypothetical protein
MPAAGRLSFVCACAVLPALALALRGVGLARIDRFLAAAAPARSRPVNAFAIKSIAHGVDAASRHGLYRATCLERSLLLRSFLSLAGVDAELRIGVRMSEGELDAHAWLEVDGRPINDHATVAHQFLAFDAR